MRLGYFRAVCLTTVFATLALAQSQAPISTDGSDPAKWDRNLDGPIAAPANHKILFENDNIRVQSVTIPPGTEEPYHLHPYYSVLVIDSLPAKAMDRDGKGNVIKEPVYLSRAKTFPFIGVQPPNSLHSVKNADPAQPVHLIRIEFKTGIPRLVSFPGMGPISSQGPLPISTNGSDPATWDPNKASAIAAPGNHKIIFENENLRVISVTIPRGTTEPQHDHPFISLLLIDSNADDIDHDLSGKIEVTPQSRVRQMIPFAFLQPPQALHAVEDRSTDKDGHLIRIEFKKGFKQL